MTNELQTVGAMHQCRTGEPYSTCVHCGALAEALNKPCPHFMRDAAHKLAAVASPTPQADSQPAPEYVGNGMFNGETIQKAAEHWANWCDVRSIGGVAEFLRVVAATPAFWTPEEIAAAKESAKKFEPWLADADRSARAPADSVTPPAGGAVAGPVQVAGAARTFGYWQTHPVHEPLGDHSHIPLTTADKADGWTEAPLAAQAADSVLEDAASAGFFLQLPQRPKPEAPAGTVGLGWDAYSGAQMLAYGRDCSNAAIVATQKPGGV